ncbi:MAG: UDP-N-acetylmuramoyl-L-alanyl-D-glutamate--2,6-diaminopimelate ligase [Eubacteriales bacterium]|nr:UDP-N-acetylmuramoyl-L-alanyl-D-glutamate--2,6-diaminopimelate ligase [Eubacteriales bacterium]
MQKYTLAQYRQLLQNKNMLVEAVGCDANEEPVSLLTYDSKAVRPGTLFICKGAAFKKQYLDEAIKKGAICYVSEVPYDTETKIPYMLVKDIRLAMPPLAVWYNNHPEEALTLIGIGGTKGKSTSAYYMKAIIDDYMMATGESESAILSSIDTYDGVICEESRLTTPEAVALWAHFRNAVNSHIKYFQMEVSAQALKYHRVDDVRFDVGMFLNISEDHISPVEHPDFEDYFSSKLLMFEQCKQAVINKDADYYARIESCARACEKVLTFSTKDATADVYGYAIRKDGDETVFMVRTKDFDEEFRLTMPGLFNVENALAVIAASLLLDIPKKYMHSGLYRARSKGRMEMYVSRDKNLITVVDYAHNKLSFERLYASIREEYPDYAIASVFGCVGGKALNRRQELGTIVGQYAKKAYLTAIDPGDEPFEKICSEIGVHLDRAGCPYEVIEDRGEAIRTAISEVSGKTVLLVTGHGSGTKIHYKDHVVNCKSDIEYVRMYMEAYDSASEVACTEI